MVKPSMVKPCFSGMVQPYGRPWLSQEPQLVLCFIILILNMVDYTVLPQLTMVEQYSENHGSTTVLFWQGIFTVTAESPH